MILTLENRIFVILICRQ